jgi:hypothetical protein
MYVFAGNMDAKPIGREVVGLSSQQCIDQYRQILLRCVCRQELDRTSRYLLSLIVDKARPERCVRILCRIVLLDLDAGVVIASILCRLGGGGATVAICIMPYRQLAYALYVFC